jgi:tetratricopeptide (TPR) repeat protein
MNFDVARAVITEHGGTIEKFIGDAVMAVFGLPRVHEDDALRAVRAAMQIQRSVASLNDELERIYGIRVSHRVGVNTGEVVAGEPTPGQRLVTGDTVNVAARLEQSAPPMEILIGEPTYRLVKDHVEAEEVEPLELKGKSQRVRAFRLVAVRELAAGSRAARAPLVGRAEERRELEVAFREAEANDACRLVTVVGEPGVGKSRLTEELLERRARDARVLRCRCLPYGRGITFWPLVELVRDAAGIHDTDSPATGLAKLESLVPAAPDVRDRVASAVGFVEEQFPLDEIYWGTRKLLEAVARKHPVIVHVEDVHSAEDAFLGLLEHVVDRAEAPLLLLCTSRPELLERRPDWSGALPARRLVLEPLSEDDTLHVIDRLLGGSALPGEAKQRIVALAEGNPLFVEHVLSMLVDDGLLVRTPDGWEPAGELAEFAIPGSIQAVLAARLETLSPEERAILEAASVVGGLFARAALEAIVAEPLRGLVASLLDSLAAKRLVQRSSSEFEADVYRFQHGLVRDTAYRALLKRSRASLHERFADWAERVNRDRERETEYAEILAYHLEQAHDYLVSLGPSDAHAQALGRRAAGHLSASGGRAFARGDMVAAANLLRRAVTLLPELDPGRLALLTDLSEAMMQTGEFAWAEVYLDEAAAASETTGDARLEADAALTRLLVRHHTTDDLGSWRSEVEEQTGRLIPALEELGADAELAKSWRLLGIVHASVCRWERCAEAEQLALGHARRAGLRRVEARLAAAYAIALQSGPTPVPDAVRRCEEIVESSLVDRQAEALTLFAIAVLHALGGSFEQARAYFGRGLELLRDLGGGIVAMSTSVIGARVDYLAGDLEAAQSSLRRDYAALGAIGERYLRPLVAARLARVLLELNQTEEAEAMAVEARDSAAPDDVEAHALAASVLARAAAERGDEDDAVALAEEAVGLAAGTDALALHGETLLDLTSVLSLLDRGDDALRAVEDARRLFQRKQASVLDARAERLAAAGARSNVSI